MIEIKHIIKKDFKKTEDATLTLLTRAARVSVIEKVRSVHTYKFVLKES